MKNKQLILASTSVFRKAMLERAGISFQAIDPHFDERSFEGKIACLIPAQQAKFLAEQKALLGETFYRTERKQQSEACYFLGSDQILALDNQVFHKVKTKAEAFQRLMFLSGKRHALYSAFAIAHKGEIIHSEVVPAFLTMRSLSSEFIETYLQKEGQEIFKSVGCYQIEKAGINLFETIEGDLFSIIGLPILPVLQALRKLKLVN